MEVGSTSHSTAEEPLKGDTLGLPLRVSIRSSDGRWLEVLPGSSGRMVLLPPSTREATQYLLEPLAGTNSYLLSSMEQPELHAMALVSGSQGGAGEPATLVMGKRQAALSVTAPCSTGQKDWMTVEARFDMQGKLLIGVGGAEGWLLAAARRRDGRLQVLRSRSCSSGPSGRRKLRAGSYSGQWPRGCRRRGVLFDAVERLPASGGRGHLQLPLRLYLRGAGGAFLCASGHIVREATQVPCCCDEFVLDVPTAFQSSASGRSSSAHVALGCRLWTGDCKSLVTAEANGTVMNVGQHECHGCDCLSLSVVEGGRLRLVWEQPKQQLRPSWLQRRLRRQRRPNEGTEWILEPEVVSASPVMIVTHHGQFLSADKRVADEDARGLVVVLRQDQTARVVAPLTHDAVDRDAVHCIPLSRALSSRRQSLPRQDEQQMNDCTREDACQGATGHPRGEDTLQPNEAISAAWRLRYHGDRIYSIHLPREGLTGRSGRFLFIDNLGRIGVTQSSAAAFPNPSCLFELELRTVSPAGAGPVACMGFSLRTVQIIEGARMFLRAEPNGRLVTSFGSKPGPWGVFSLVDVASLQSCPIPSPWQAMVRTDSPPDCCTESAQGLHALAASIELALNPRRRPAPVGPRVAPKKSFSLRGDTSTAQLPEVASGWGLRNPETLQGSCLRSLVFALKSESQEHALFRLSLLDLPDEIQKDAVRRWWPLLSNTDAFRCTTVVPREWGALPDPQHNARDMRHRIDSFFECCNCGAAHLAMDPRINSLHHRHLEYLRRRAYNAEGVRRRESLARASSRMLLLAAVSLFIGAVLGTMVSPATHSGNAQRRAGGGGRQKKHKPCSCTDREAGAHSMEGEAAGGPLQWILGSLQSWTTILPRDHWTWAYAVAMKGLSYFSWG